MYIYSSLCNKLHILNITAEMWMLKKIRQEHIDKCLHDQHTKFLFDGISPARASF